MFRRLRWVIGLVFMVLTIAPCGLMTYLGYRDPAVRWWCGLGLWTMGVRAKLAEPEAGRKLSQSGGALIVANHSSYIDILVLGALSPGAFLAKGEIASWPLMGMAARAGGVLFVKRDSPRASRVLIDTVGKALEEGNRVLIFPEGGILSNLEGGEALGEFKPMFFQACVDTGRPVIPAGIRHILPSDPEALRWGEGVGIYEHMMTRVLAAEEIVMEVRFAEPLVPGEGLGRKELARRAREEVARLIS